MKSATTMMNRYRLSILQRMALCALALPLTAWLPGGSASANAQVLTLKLGHALPGGDHPYQLGAQKFADIVSSKTGGRFKVDIFNSGQLGGERDMVEGLKR